MEKRSSPAGDNTTVFADEHNPAEAELDATTVWAYQTAWSERYLGDKDDVQINATGLARIRQRIARLTMHRVITGESFGAAYKRTAVDFMRAWIGRNGQDESEWLAKRFHPMQCLADGSRKSPDADLEFAQSAVLRADRELAKMAALRAKKAQEIEAHTAGPRLPARNPATEAQVPGARLPVRNTFTALIPNAVAVAS